MGGVKQAEMSAFPEFCIFPDFRFQFMTQLLIYVTRWNYANFKQPRIWHCHFFDWRYLSVQQGAPEPTRPQSFNLSYIGSAQAFL